MRLDQRPISRTALVWLLMLQLGVLLPVALQLPIWLLLIAGGCWGWRFAIFQGVASPPARWIKLALVASCLSLVVWQEGHLSSLRSFALLLALGFLFKLVELRNLRDAYTLLFVALLLLTANLLLSQSLTTSLLTAIGLLTLLGAWVGLNQVGPELQWRQSLKWASALYLLALPLTLLMFVLVPRIPPIWQIATDSGQAQVGLSDSMSPGDISRLARSDALAFRVSFSADRPEQQDLYWRTVVMTGFDGRRWWQEGDYWLKRRDFELKGWAKPLTERNSQWISWPDVPRLWSVAEAFEAPYQVIMEPSQQHWLPALDNPRVTTKHVGLMADQRLIYRFPIQQRFQYEVQSGQSAQLLAIEQQLLAEHQQRYLAFPSQSNPQMQRWAKQLWQQTGSAQAFITAFSRHTFTQEYQYTLEPPLLGEQAVDEFWFQTRQGFCAHYASALALALRVVGVPSRVIGGYQGGEWQSEGEFLQVRQYDAHAWVEYWQSGEGWLRVDPTAWVAPHRIRQSFAESLRTGQTLGAEAIISWRLTHSGWLTQLQSQWDQLEYLWHKKVLNYKAEQQYELLKSWFGQVNWRWLMIALVVVVVGFLTLLALWQSKPWQTERVSIEQALYRRFVKRLAGLELIFEPHQPLSQLLPQLNGLSDEKRVQVKQAIMLFDALLYQPLAANQVQLQKELRRLLKTL